MTQIAIMVMICLIIQVVLIGAARIAIAILCGRFFDKEGARRMPTPLFKNFPKLGSKPRSKTNKGQYAAPKAK